jgi:uncharacterized protein involved in response to NO
MQIENGGRPEGRGFALFERGFRPFFLGAAVMAVAWMALWVLVLRGLSLDSHYGAYYWHAHEMIFGYTAAVIAGFLLTAVENWTDQPTVRGSALAALFILWGAGRLLAFVPGAVPDWGIALVDLAFLPALAAVLAVPLARSGQARNFVFVLLLGLLAAADAMVQGELLGLTEGTMRKGTVLGLGVVLIAIVIIGGRVFPMFTARIPGVRPRSRPLVEVFALGSLVLFVLAVQARPRSDFAGASAALAAVSHGVRLAGWHHREVWRVPLVWVLHLGYAWLVAGFALWAVAAFADIPHTLALHAFTAGCIGVLTVGMMARVALGHTDRPLSPPRPVVAAFVLVNLAAAARVLVPLAAPAWYTQAVFTAAALWIMAFVLFLSVYAQILVRPSPRAA